MAASSSAFVEKAALPTRASFTLNAVELAPEPEGGEEVTALKSLEGTRVKNMGEVEGITNDDGTVYNFWINGLAQGALIKELNTQVLKDAKKKADFPGFRKVWAVCRIFSFNGTHKYLIPFHCLF